MGGVKRCDTVGFLDMGAGIKLNGWSGLAHGRTIGGALLSALPLLVAFWTMPSWAQLSVGEGHVRGLPPGQTVTSAYMTLLNSGEDELIVLQVSTPVAQSVEFHSHEHRDGVMRMRREDALLVPPRGKLSLEPGSLHLMLFGLKRQLHDGEMISLRLSGEGFSCVDTQLPVVGVLSGPCCS